MHKIYQYFYRKPSYKALLNTPADLQCWYDEGTGPLPSISYKNNNKLFLWREKPAPKKEDTDQDPHPDLYTSISQIIKEFKEQHPEENSNTIVAAMAYTIHSLRSELRTLQQIYNNNN